MMILKLMSPVTLLARAAWKVTLLGSALVNRAKSVKVPAAAYSHLNFEVLQQFQKGSAHEHTHAKSADTVSEYSMSCNRSLDQVAILDAQRPKPPGLDDLWVKEDWNSAKTKPTNFVSFVHTKKKWRIIGMARPYDGKVSGEGSKYNQGRTSGDVLSAIDDHLKNVGAGDQKRLLNSIDGGSGWVRGAQPDGQFRKLEATVRSLSSWSHNKIFIPDDDKKSPSDEYQDEMENSIKASVNALNDNCVVLYHCASGGGRTGRQLIILFAYLRLGEIFKGDKAKRLADMTKGEKAMKEAYVFLKANYHPDVGELPSVAPPGWEPKFDSDEEWRSMKKFMMDKKRQSRLPEPNF